MQRRQFMRTAFLAAGAFALGGAQNGYSWSGLSDDQNSSTVERLRTKGVILNTEDLSTVNWPKIASEAGLTTVATHFGPSEVVPFMQREDGKRFVRECEKYGIEMEHELHAMSDLLPRSLFNEDPTMFRMDEKGDRVQEWNCCPHSKKGLDIIVKNAIEVARICRSTTGRYFFWIDDGHPLCVCPQCREFSYSEQALLIENAIVQGLQAEIGSNATLAHLAYFSTMTPPKKVKPDPAVFWEFAPIERVWDRPLVDSNAGRSGKMNHAQTLDVLDQNLEIFPKETAQILEYWIDVSLFSGWTKPVKKLPWNPDVCRSDINTYAQRGIRNFTSFAVNTNGEYLKAYDINFLKEYGALLNEWHS